MSSDHTPKKLFQQPDEKAEEEKHQTKQIQSKLNTNFYTRTRTTLYMLFGFIIVLSAGQFYSACLVLLLIFLIFNEINNLKRNQQKQVSIPMTKYINWYLFIIVNYFCLGTTIKKKMPIMGFYNLTIYNLLQYHNIICFSLLIIGFLGFVMSLKQGYLKYQFRLFSWIVLATIMVCVQGWFMINNIFEGQIWFIQATLLIICNDIFAYIFGYFFGKRQLISLSPKKTWEGYIGGAIITLLFSLILTSALLEIPGVSCPMITPNLIPFNFPTCQSPLLQNINVDFLNLTFSRLQLHMVFLSLFASIIGPFGGFFASGLKRSIKIKDFGNTIPGHGGVSDRMDCQLVMGSFCYFYLHSIVLMSSNANFWLRTLDSSQLQIIYKSLKQILIAKGIQNVVK